MLDPAVEFLARLAGSGPALEFAVGTGRVAVPLVARGIPVTGIELSAPMAERLRRKVSEDQLPVFVDPYRDLPDAGHHGWPARDGQTAHVGDRGWLTLADGHPATGIIEAGDTYQRPIIRLSAGGLVAVEPHAIRVPAAPTPRSAG